MEQFNSSLTHCGYIDINMLYYIFEALVMNKIVMTVFFGLLWALLATEVFAQWPLGKEMPQAGAKTQESVLSGTGSGRHQIFVSPHIKGHTFMIDTETGKIWIFRKDGASGDFSLQRVPVERDGQPTAETTQKQGSGGSSLKGQ